MKWYLLACVTLLMLAPFSWQAGHTMYRFYTIEYPMVQSALELYEFNQNQTLASQKLPLTKLRQIELKESFNDAYTRAKIISEATHPVR